jgi:phosphoribosylformylglycinamidine cyclo-ligase
MDYKASGVDIDAGNEAVRRIRGLARSTFTSGVLSDIGSFGGLFKLDTERWREPVLVSSADGVGTKLKVAFLSNRHDTIGADLVNHCVNDILVQGAEPLFFFDYLGTGKLAPAVAEQIVSGMAAACRENGCALLGGETAEMPGFYGAGEYDLAGFIIGAVRKDRLIDGRGIVPGDAIVALPSSGLHTNGYSLARRIVFEHLGLTVTSPVPELGTTAGAALLTPHRSYLPVIRPLLDAGILKGLAHITGGGVTDNLPRVLPEGTGAVIERGSWTVPPLFAWLVRAGGVPREDAWRTFNMGLGLLAVVAPDRADELIAALAAAGEPAARVVGRIERGDRSVRYVD